MQPDRRHESDAFYLPQRWQDIPPRSAVNNIERQVDQSRQILHHNELTQTSSVYYDLQAPAYNNEMGLLLCCDLAMT